MQQFDGIEVTTGNQPTGSVVWLHGLGADGHDFEPVVPELRLPDDLALRFVFPHAPVRPVTINGGMAMRAWYDIVSFDASGRADAEGIRESTGLLESLVDREVDRGIDEGRVVIAGFSQGGAIAINAALKTRRRLAGLVALSTYIAGPKELQSRASGDVPPVFMAHGTFDPVIPIAWGRASAEGLRDAGFDVEWREYPMAHAVCAEEITDIRDWLLEVFAP